MALVALPQEAAVVAAEEQCKMRIYYIAPPIAFQSLYGVEWAAETETSPGEFLGWVEWRTNANAISPFEARADVTVLGHIFSGNLNSSKLVKFGVQPADLVADVLERIYGRIYLAHLKS